MPYSPECMSVAINYTKRKLYFVNFQSEKTTQDFVYNKEYGTSDLLGREQSWGSAKQSQICLESYTCLVNLV